MEDTSQLGYPHCPDSSEPLQDLMVQGSGLELLQKQCGTMEMGEAGVHSTLWLPLSDLA